MKADPVPSPGDGSGPRGVARPARHRSRWLLYGAYGYTGELIARLAAERGEAPILAGRDGERTRGLADALNFGHRVFSLEDPAAVDAGLAGVDAVLHAAGPYVDTCRPMIDACLRTGTQYLDITGEIGVLEMLAGMDERARAAGIVVLPGVGFDVVPTDCAAALAAGALADAGCDTPARLEIAFHSTGGMSRGTARSAVRGLATPPVERRDGRLVPFRWGSLMATIPFSDRPRRAAAIPWGDVATAYRSTGAPDIRAYATASPRALRVVRLLGVLRPLLALGPVSRLLTRWVDRNVTGPDPETLATGRTRVWCRAEGRPEGGAAVAFEVELVTPDPYALTADAALTAVTTLLADAGEIHAGFQTPATAFGPGFVDRLEGVEWVRRP